MHHAKGRTAGRQIGRMTAVMAMRQARSIAVWRIERHDVDQTLYLHDRLDWLARERTLIMLGWQGG